MPDGSTATLTLDDETQDRLRRLASARQLPTDALMREAIEEYVDRAEKRAQFRQDALDALAEYQATGLHATGEEVDAWLERLEAGEDAAPPQCHG